MCFYLVGVSPAGHAVQRHLVDGLDDLLRLAPVGRVNPEIDREQPFGFVGFAFCFASRGGLETTSEEWRVFSPDSTPEDERVENNSLDFAAKRAERGQGKGPWLLPSQETQRGRATALILWRRSISAWAIKHVLNPLVSRAISCSRFHHTAS